MIAEWRTYSVEDFVPFTPEVYFRLIERVNEAQWPLQLPMLLGGAAVLVLLHFDRGRTAGALLAIGWFWAGIAFFIRRYADLNWAGEYFGWAFCIQGLVLLACAATGQYRGRGAGPVAAPQWLGFAIAGYGLAVYPFLAVFGGGGWGQSEVFGIHPDPTAITTLGILLIAAKGWSLWIACVIPILWCIAGGLTLWVLEAPWAAGLFVVAVLAPIGMIWGLVRRKTVERKVE